MHQYFFFLFLLRTTVTCCRADYLVQYLTREHSEQWEKHSKWLDDRTGGWSGEGLHGCFTKRHNEQSLKCLPLSILSPLAFQLLQFSSLLLLILSDSPFPEVFLFSLFVCRSLPCIAFTLLSLYQFICLCVPSLSLSPPPSVYFSANVSAIHFLSVLSLQFTHVWG